MPPAIYLPEARDNIDEAYTHYQNRSAGLGERFLTSLQRTIGQVETSPQLYGEMAFERPRCVGFPTSCTTDTNRTK